MFQSLIPSVAVGHCSHYHCHNWCYCYHCYWWIYAKHKKNWLNSVCLCQCVCTWSELGYNRKTAAIMYVCNNWVIVKFICSPWNRESNTRLVVCYQIITGTAPQYLAELVRIYVPSRSLRSSSDDRTFRIPTFKRKQHGGRAFCSSAAETWNSLPLVVRHSPSLPAFKTNFKTSFQTIVWLVIVPFSVLLIMVCVFQWVWDGWVCYSCLDIISVYSEVVKRFEWQKALYKYPLLSLNEIDLLLVNAWKFLKRFLWECKWQYMWCIYLAPWTVEYNLHGMHK